MVRDDNDNLDRILNKGDITLKDSMFIIALELKQQRQNIEAIHEALKNTSAQFSTQGYVDNKFIELDKRIKPFEEARKWVITTVFSVLVLALLSLVLVVKR